MSNIKPDDFRKHAAEEDFFRLAAIEIVSEQNEEFLEAQSLPDPSPEVLARMQKSMQTTMRNTRKRKRHRTIFLQLGRFTACMAVVCGVLFSGAYFGVDAARNSINNFVLEMFDDHATVKTEASVAEEGLALPTNWEGPFYITWVPAKFTNTEAIELNYNWILKYSSETHLANMSICVWDAAYAPNIDIEKNSTPKKVKIQDSTAAIYHKEGNKICTLLWTKSDYIIMISGNISSSEAIKIAENFVI